MSTTHRSLYVVAASDCTWPGVLGVHTSRKAAMAHLDSVKRDRLRWYRVEWDWAERETAYTREHDPLMRVREVRLVPDEAKEHNVMLFATLSLVVLRVWR
jgi:hypothetical protein